MEIQRRSRTTLLFISHDLSIVRYLSDRVVVMYLGHIVETGTTDQVFAPPYHPYTEALLSAVPIADTKIKRKRIVLDGDIPSAKPAIRLSVPIRCGYKADVGDHLSKLWYQMCARLNGYKMPFERSWMEPVIALVKPKSKAAPKKKTLKNHLLARHHRERS